MKLDFNEEQLLELMKDFYTLTGIRMVLFDDEYQQLLSYPPSDCAFCAQLKSHSATRLLCAQSDRNCFEQCKSARKMMVYHCHAGLIEAAVPLIRESIVIGYLMFGQISDAPSTAALKKILLAANLLPESSDLESLLCEIPLKSSEQIHAAAKIMETCTFYALMSETIAPRRQNFTRHLKEYLLPRLGQHLDAEGIAKDLNISRSKLYMSCDKYLGMGIAEYIRILRMEEAQRLLRDSDLSITQIADDVGFEDYNYFCRVFKKETGYSAKKYREQFKE